MIALGAVLWVCRLVKTWLSLDVLYTDLNLHLNIRGRERLKRTAAVYDARDDTMAS